MRVVKRGAEVLITIECPDCLSILEFSRDEVIRNSTDYLGDRNPPYVTCPECKEDIPESAFPRHKVKTST